MLEIRLLRFLPFACAVALVSCASKAAPPPVSADAWATVDGREIRRDDVEKAYRRLVDLNARPSDPEALNTKLSLLNDMIMQDLMMAKAKTLGIEVSGTDIENAYAERKKNTSEDAFQKQLADRHLTESDVKDELRRELTTQKLIEREVTSKTSVSDKEVTDFFTANRAQFNLPEPAYRIAQIVVTPTRDSQIANRQNDDATTPEAAARKIKMLTDRLRAGAQFSELAMDYSEDPQSAPQGGDLGLISTAQLRQANPALRDAVLKAQPGSLSQVGIDGGYALILLIGKEPAGQRDLTTPGVRDGIVANLREQKQQLRQAAFLTSLRNDANVVNLLARQVMEEPKTPPTVAPAAPPKK
jgi:peptidyl-prolyl cis-trans isomerase SurA